MMSFFDFINKYNNKDVPPIMRGTKLMIMQLAREERKISELNKSSPDKTYSMIRKKEDISEIFTKYVNQDFNKEAYLFIK